MNQKIYRIYNNTSVPPLIYELWLDNRQVSDTILGGIYPFTFANNPVGRVKYEDDFYDLAVLNS